MFVVNDSVILSEANLNLAIATFIPSFVAPVLNTLLVVVLQVKCEPVEVVSRGGDRGCRWNYGGVRKKASGINSRAAITARKETPFRMKHQAGPKAA